MYQYSYIHACGVGLSSMYLIEPTIPLVTLFVLYHADSSHDAVVLLRCGRDV